MAKTKQQLIVENNEQFPNNNTGFISPSRLRTYNRDIIDSMVDEIPFGEYTASVAADSASFNSRIDAIMGGDTGSLLVTASASGTTITFTKGDASTFGVTISTETIDTGSFATTGSNTFTAGQTISGSVILTIGSALAFGDSGYIEDDGGSLRIAHPTEINLATDRTITEGILESRANTILGVNASANTRVTGSFSVSGSTQLSGSLKHNALNFPTSSGTDGFFLQTNGNNQANWRYVKTLYEDVKNGNGTTLPKGTPVFASGSVGNQSIVIAADAGDPTRMPATYVLNQELAPGAEGLGIVIGFINGVDTSAFNAGDVIYVGVGGGFTNVQPTGSALIQPLGIVNKVDATNGSGIVLNPGVSNGLPNIAEGNAWVGNVDGVPTAVPTSSFGGGSTIDTGSFATTGSNNFSGSQNFYLDEGFNGGLFVIGNANGAPSINITTNGDDGETLFTMATSGSQQFVISTKGVGDTSGSQEVRLTGPQGQFIIQQYGTLSSPETYITEIGNYVDSVLVNTTFTASLEEGYAWVGDSTGKSVAVATSSFGGTTIDTASFATTSSNSYIGFSTSSLSSNPSGSFGDIRVMDTVLPVLDSNFTGRASAVVNDIAVQSDGKFIIAGNFTTYAGTTRGRVARINTNGTLDGSFGNANANGEVRTIALQSDGKVLIGGDFTTVSATNRNRLARVTTGGALDTGFDAFVSSSVTVNDIVVDGSGNVIFGGNFTFVSGSARNRIARVNSSGLLDTTFNPDLNNVCLAMAIQTDGKLLIAGNFTTVSGSTRNRIARFNTDDTLEAAFTASVTLGEVRAMAVQSDDKIVIGGTFAGVNGATRNRIARLNSDGTLDTSFDPNVGGNINALAIQSDGKIVIGGTITDVGGVLINKLARLNSDGTLDTTFKLNLPSGDIFGITETADDKTVIGGTFTIVNDVLSETNVVVANTEERVALINNNQTLYGIYLYTNQWKLTGNLVI